MNTIVCCYALLAVALIVALGRILILSKEVRGEREQREQAEQSAAHHKELEEAEEARADGLLDRNVSLQRKVDDLDKTINANACTLASLRAAHEIEKQRATLAPRPARFALEGGMSEELMTNLLSGGEKLPVMRAVFALVGAEVVRLSDRATDAPCERIDLPDRTLAAYTEEMRLHDAGGASAMARLLARLQDLAAVKPEPSAESRAA